MGQIDIHVRGSFKNTTPSSVASRSFSALDLGHAAALTEAIAYLTSLLPRSIALDHDLHADGARPALGFGVAESVPSGDQP